MKPAASQNKRTVITGVLSRRANRLRKASAVKKPCATIIRKAVGYAHRNGHSR